MNDGRARTHGGRCRGCDCDCFVLRCGRGEEGVRSGKKELTLQQADSTMPCLRQLRRLQHPSLATATALSPADPQL